MFDNKITKTMYGPVHYSRLVASYRNICDKEHKPFYYEDLMEYLKALHVDAPAITEIIDIATCGKMECESMAREILRGRYERLDLWNRKF